jgi:hypothetical protein
LLLFLKESVARELGLRPVPGAGIDQSRHGDGDPLLAGLEPAARSLVAARPTVTARLHRRHEAVAVGVGGAGVDRIGEDVVHHRRRPGVTTGAGVVRSGVQSLEDLADGHLLVTQPAVEHAHQFGLGVIDHEMAGHGIVARHVAVAVRGAATEVMPVTCLLQLAAAEALAQHGALVLGDGALDLQQQLVIRVIRDRVLQERHLAARPAELLEQQDLIGVAPRQTVGAQHRDEVDSAVADRVAQGVEAGSVEPGATVALVTEDVLLRELVPSSRSPAPQGSELAVDGLLAFLALGRDAGIEGGAHGGLTSACGRERADGEVSRRRR